jgi:hypothetical protein
MINKRRITSLILGVLATTALAACGGQTKSSTPAASSTTPVSSAPASSTPTPVSSTPASSTASIPVVEGKVTFYFHFKATDAVASLPTYVSPYLDGVMNGWTEHPSDPATANDPVEMKLLAGTDIYYGSIAVDWAKISADAGYQITLGYNASSGVSLAKQGVDYTHKSDYCATFSGLSHPVFSEPKNSLVDLMGGEGVDYQTFTTIPPEPVILHHYSLALDPSELTDAPTDNWFKGYMIKGSFNSWTSVALAKGTGDYANDYVIDLGDVIATAKIEFCVAPVTTAIHEVKDDYLLTGTGTHLADTVDANDATKITKPGNLTITPLKLDKDNHTQVWGKLQTYTGYKWPTAPVAMTDDITVTFTNSGTDAMPSTVTSVRLVGEVTNWTPSDTANEMTKSADGKSYTFTISHLKSDGTQLLYVDVIYNFKIVANGDWAGAVCGDAATDSNMTFQAGAKKIHLDVSSDWSKFGVTKANGTVNYYGDGINGVVVTLKNSGTAGLASTVTSLSLVGELTSWDNTATANDMTKVDANTYTFAIPDGKVYAGTTYGLKVIANHAWANDVATASDGNLSYTAVKGQAKVTITADFSTIGSAITVGTVTSAA